MNLFKLQISGKQCQSYYYCDKSYTNPTQPNPTPKVTRKMAEAVQDETALHLDETVVDPKDTVEHVLDTVEVER